MSGEAVSDTETQPGHGSAPRIPPLPSPCMDWTRFLTVSGRTLRAAHFSIRTGGMWLYISRLSTLSGSSCIESMNWLRAGTKP